LVRILRDISKLIDFGISLFLKKLKKSLDLELTPRSKITLNIETAEYLASNRSADIALEGRK
jgi:hypothetical protein